MPIIQGVRAYASIKAQLVCGGIALLIYALFFLGQMLIMASLAFLWLFCAMASIHPAWGKRGVPGLAARRGRGLVAPASA